MIKVKQKAVFEVDYNDLNDFINTEYGFGPRQFEVVADQEWGNDESHSIILSKRELPEYDKLFLEKFKKSEKVSYVLYIILQDLVNRDRLAPGEYIIDVSW